MIFQSQVMILCICHQYEIRMKKNFSFSHIRWSIKDVNFIVLIIKLTEMPLYMLGKTSSFHMITKKEWRIAVRLWSQHTLVFIVNC